MESKFHGLRGARVPHVDVCGLNNSEAKASGHHFRTALLHHKTPASPDADTVARVFFQLDSVKHDCDAHPIAGQGKAAIALLTALEQPPIPWLKHPADSRDYCREQVQTKQDTIGTKNTTTSTVQISSWLLLHCQFFMFLLVQELVAY